MQSYLYCDFVPATQHLIDSCSHVTSLLCRRLLPTTTPRSRPSMIQDTMVTPYRLADCKNKGKVQSSFVFAVTKHDPPSSDMRYKLSAQAAVLAGLHSSVASSLQYSINRRMVLATAGCKLYLTVMAQYIKFSGRTHLHRSSSSRFGNHWTDLESCD